MGRYAKDDGKIIISHNEELRQRIKNPSRISTEGKITFDSSSEDDEAFLADQLKLELDDIAQDKGLMGMKFMQDAIKRQRDNEKTISDHLLSELTNETSKFKFSGEPQKKRKIEKVEKTKKKPEKNSEKIQKSKKISEKTEKSEKISKKLETFEKLSKQKEIQESMIEKAFEEDEMDKIAAEEWAKEQQEKQEKTPKSLNG